MAGVVSSRIYGASTKRSALLDENDMQTRSSLHFRQAMAKVIVFLFSMIR